MCSPEVREHAWTHGLSLPLPQENTLVWEPRLQHFTHFITNCFTMHTTNFGRPKRLMTKHEGGFQVLWGQNGMHYCTLGNRKQVLGNQILHGVHPTLGMIS
jgi:hypothetical protein